jgi:glutamate--cysteine ligase
VSLSVEDLIDHFRAGAKPREKFRVGIEQEKIGARADGAPVPYQGRDGIEAVLARLVGRGFAATREHQHIVWLERNGERITIEPGGQFEFSGAPRDSAAACRDALVAHVREVAEVARPLGIHFLGIGARPFGKISDVDWLPKRRYDMMKHYYFAAREDSPFRLAHHMMKMTATVQATFDYESEQDAVDRLRTAFGVTSIVTALFAASPLVEGRPGPDKSFRAAVWLETDPRRCGLLRCAFEPDFSFRHYVEWALDVPMLFIVRGDSYFGTRSWGGPGDIPDDFTFRRFMAEGFNGEAMMRDWETHLSTLFPEVRLKRTIELRGADAGPMPMAAALAALWRGLLDDTDARAGAWELVAGHSFADREALRREVPRAALRARFGGRRLQDLALELIRISDAGLARLPGGEDDRPLLAPLWAYASAGRTPADDMLDDYEAVSGDPAKLVARWELKA